MERVHDLISRCAEEFAEACRTGQALPSKDPKTAANDPGREGRLVSFKAQPDECHAFLRAVENDVIFVKPSGRFWAHTARRSSRNLHLVGRSGLATALHTEYLIHIGGYAELVLDYGWPPDLLDFECGAFDVEGGNQRLVLAMEAKARVLPATGDTLTALRDALLARAADPQAELNVNHLKKWNRLLDLSQAGPLWLWLVADNARWSYVVEQSGQGVSLTPMEGPPIFAAVTSITSERHFGPRRGAAPTI